MLSLPFAKEWQHRRSLETAVASNRKAVAVSTQLHTESQTDFLNVLTAQRALVLAEGALVRSQSSIALDVIARYKALGGGWDRGAPAGSAP
jgi:outer membrane protein, multidrug efflux system